MRKTVYIAWTNHDSRASSLAYYINAKLYFINGLKTNSKWLAPFKYTIDSMITLTVLIKENPNTIIVINPPIFSVLIAWIYCQFNRHCTYIVDTHSSAFTAKRWAQFLWLYRILSKRALLNILHNDDLKRLVAKWGGPTSNMGEIPYKMESDKIYAFKRKINITFVCLHSADEPLQEVVEAAEYLPNIDFYITGALHKAPKNIVKMSPSNVLFTDFLPDDEYKALLSGSDIIISLTKNNSTMQNGAYEALTLGRPIITSDWPVLRKIYYKGTVCVDNNHESIIQAIKTIMADYPRYFKEIHELRLDMEKIWKRNIAELSMLMENHVLKNNSL